MIQQLYMIIFDACKLTEVVHVQVQSLHQAETCVTEQHKACEDLKADLSATGQELSIMRSTHLNTADNARKEISKLGDELQAARLHVNTVDSNLKDSLAKQAQAETTIQSLTSDIEDLQKQLHAGTEQIDRITSDLQAKAAAYNDLTTEHQNTVDKYQKLSTSLQQSEEQLQARSSELEQAVAAMESERSVKVRCSYGVQWQSTASLLWSLALLLKAVRQS